MYYYIFFYLPNNYIKINSAKNEAYFQLFFFQRWNFFAPSPSYNERLYYILKKKNADSLKVFEVFEKLYKEKARKAPFNNKEDVLDYLLSNSVGSIAEEINEIRNYKNFLVKTSQLAKDTSITAVSGESIERLDNFKTLLNYGKLVASIKYKNATYDSIGITITRKYLPRFYYRNSDTTIVEEVFFKSKFHDIHE